MKKVLFALCLLFILGCTADTESEVAETVFKEECRLSDRLLCNDYRVYEDRIELYVTNKVGVHIESVHIATDGCDSINNPKFFANQMVKFVLTGCNITGDVLDQEIYIDYVDQLGRQEVHGHISKKLT